MKTNTCPDFIRWYPTEERRRKYCEECPYPRFKVSKDENLDFLLDLIDEYVACVEAVTEIERGIK